MSRLDILAEVAAKACGDAKAPVLAPGAKTAAETLEVEADKMPPFRVLSRLLRKRGLVFMNLLNTKEDKLFFVSVAAAYFKPELFHPKQIEGDKRPYVQAMVAIVAMASGFNHDVVALFSEQLGQPHRSDGSLCIPSHKHRIATVVNKTCAASIRDFCSALQQRMRISLV